MGVRLSPYMKKLFPSFLSAFLAASIACAADAPKPFGVVPTNAQVKWQRMEYYAFVHFGLNTYTGREWGYGDENPELFNPSDFDASKIVKTFKDAGMKGMIYTAKHHDGFCTWPTKSTKHNITRSPWKNGKGDVVKEFSEACKEHGIKFGTYLSPWDRNCAEYGRPGYLKVYYKQINELLTNYGPIFEIWFDGANGGDGYYGGAKEKRNIGKAGEYYNFEKIVSMIRKKQPKCIIWGADSHGDARWGGTEDGHVNYPFWNTIGKPNWIGGKPVVPTCTGGCSHPRYPDSSMGVRGGDHWVAAEADTKINNAGWFWHRGQSNRVKSLDKLIDTWFRSVGYGANLILNVAPDQTGRLDPADVERLMEFKKWRDEFYAKDYALGASVLPSQVRGNDQKFAGSKMTDGKIESYWAVEDNNLTPQAVITLKETATFDVIRLREQIRLGQRVDSFTVEAYVDGKWVMIDDGGQTIGNQVLRRLKEPVTTNKLRLKITGSQATPCISEFSLLLRPGTIAAPSVSRVGDRLHITSTRKGKLIYTTDGSEPTPANALSYEAPVTFDRNGVVKARVVADDGKLGPVRSMDFGICKKDWKVVSASSGNAVAAIDDSTDTFWTSEAAAPQSFVVDMGKAHAVKGFSYTPRQDGKWKGMTDRYTFEVSADGKKWTKAAEGEFSNLKASPVKLDVLFKKTQENIRFFRFTGTRVLEGSNVTVGEIDLLGE